MRFDSASADRITAVILFALGAAMLVGGYTMDRLEIRQIHPASIPGLVPMILGVTMMICSACLFAGAVKRGREEAEDQYATAGESWGRLLATAGLGAVYALILVGWLPFFAATALFVGTFILCFTWPIRGSGADRLKAILIALIFALATAGAISALFRYGFLVRLP